MLSVITGNSGKLLYVLEIMKTCIIVIFSMGSIKQKDKLEDSHEALRIWLVELKLILIEMS